MGTVKKILALHGWAYDTQKWDEFVDLLEDDGIKITLLNIPGLTKATNEVWTLDDYVEWLKDIVDREKERVILMGHSNGGRIALAFSAKYPAKIEKLILIDSAGIYHNELSIHIKRFVFGSVAKIGRIITPSERLRNLIYRLAREKDYKEASPQMRRTMVNLISANLTPQLSKIKTPTLIIWGEKDRATPLSDAKIMNKLIKKSKLVVIKSARHSPHFTNTGEVAAKIAAEVKKR